ncbi:NAC transcription factor [Salix suchowensis]|nr:NAC transcription factor [Salix suchowensis]
MEKFNFVRDGMSRLPPGFRFQPTEEELVNVCKYDPWDLPGDMEQERYFFSCKEAKYPKGNRVNRASSSGFWKATGLDKQIVSSTGRIIMLGKAPHGSRTDWVMHEYRLNSSFQLDKWVVCRIFLKKKAQGAQPRLFDFMARDETVFDSVSSSCSSSSNHADFISSNEQDHEQSSSRNFF